jgi:hypothetical protein
MVGAWLPVAGDSPEVNVFELGPAEDIVQGFEELIGGLPAFVAHLVLAVGAAEVHFVAAASECVSVGKDFAAGAGIDVIDAVFDAGSDDVASVLLKVVCATDVRKFLPVTAEAERRDPEAGFSEPAIFHIRVIAAGRFYKAANRVGFAGSLIGFGVLSSHGTHTNSQASGGQRTVSHKLTAGNATADVRLRLFTTHFFLYSLF